MSNTLLSTKQLIGNLSELQPGDTHRLSDMKKKKKRGFTHTDTVRLTLKLSENQL